MAMKKILVVSMAGLMIGNVSILASESLVSANQLGSEMKQMVGAIIQAGIQ